MKHLVGQPLELREQVAPHTGAWIETVYSVVCANGFSVAPHTGAWIET